MYLKAGRQGGPDLSTFISYVCVAGVEGAKQWAGVCSGGRRRRRGTPVATSGTGQVNIIIGVTMSAPQTKVPGNKRLLAAGRKTKLEGWFEVGHKTHTPSSLRHKTALTTKTKLGNKFYT